MSRHSAALWALEWLLSKGRHLGKVVTYHFSLPFRALVVIWLSLCP